MKKIIFAIPLIITGCYQQKYETQINNIYGMECQRVVDNAAARVIRCENHEAICYIGTYRTTINCKFK